MGLKKLLTFFCVVLALLFFYQSYRVLARQDIVGTILYAIDTTFLGEDASLDQYGGAKPGFTDILNKVRPSMVLVQSFSGGNLLKTSGGMVLTSDGLIIVPNSSVPFSGDFYQVHVEDKIVRGHVIHRSLQYDFAILDTDEQGLVPGNISTMQGTSGEFLTFGLSQTLSVPRLVTSQEGEVSPGSIVVDDSGSIVALITETGSRVLLAPVEDMFFNYIQTNI